MGCFLDGCQIGGFPCEFVKVRKYENKVIFSTLAMEQSEWSFGLSGAQWLSGRVLDSRPRGCRFEPHRRHCLVVLEQDTFILA